MDITDMLKKHTYVFSTMFICLCYGYFISSIIRKGFFRLISLLPVIFLLAVLPLYLPHLFFSIFVASHVAWQSISGLTLFAFGQGPLLSAQSLHAFIIHAIVPLKIPSSRFPSKPTKTSILGLQVLATAILMGTMMQYRQDLHPKILLLSYASFTLLLMDCVGAVSKYVGPGFMGLELEPPFHEPYLSSSLQEFWSKRWNLTVTDQLRRLVYNPVRSLWAPLPAVLATFLVSGLVHELLYYYVTRVEPSWKTLSFFVLHGISVVLEMCVKKALKGRLDLPPLVSVPLTVGYVVLTSLWLFFPPLIENGFFDMVFEEIRCMAEFALNGTMAYLG